MNDDDDDDEEEEEEEGECVAWEGGEGGEVVSSEVGGEDLPLSNHTEKQKVPLDLAVSSFLFQQRTELMTQAAEAVTPHNKR